RVRHAAHYRFHHAEERYLRAPHAEGRRVAVVPRAVRPARGERAGAGPGRVPAGEPRSIVLAYPETRGADGATDLRCISACAVRRVQPVLLSLRPHAGANGQR